ncbi:hypothetical protein RRG08_034069 [Elysia crispata]|uniref:Uncharacterized protein n=1 Tax=Elysia crispata TaxID=231223 RepID=A0AAE1D153_9GAST|nr:hypothetical protein RRG08_034069 [Elysia crispata]
MRNTFQRRPRYTSFRNRLSTEGKSICASQSPNLVKNTLPAPFEHHPEHYIRTMFALRKESHKPTTFFALAVCIHLIAFCLTAVGMFTPNWSEITEQTGLQSEDYVYDLGLVVSCLTDSDSCRANEHVSRKSESFYSAFVLGIAATITGFLALQFLCASVLIRSCREKNLAPVVAALSIGQAALLSLVLILFELSLGQDTTEGYYFRKSTFGYSRGLVMCAAVLYLVAALCIIVEHVRRRRRSAGTPDSLSTPVTTISYNRQKNQPSPPPRPAFSSYRARRSIMVAPVMTAMPYRKGTRPTLGSVIEDVGMRPCEVPGCQTCGYVIQSNVFLGPEGVPFGIRERLDCQEKGVVYAVICMRDDHVFIGHSQDRLESTFAMHIANIKAMNLSDPVAHHFTRPDHKIRDIRVGLVFILKDMGHKNRDIRVGLIFISRDIGYKIRDIRVGLIFILKDMGHKMRDIRVGLIFILKDMGHKMRDIRVGLIVISRDIGHKIRDIRVGLVFISRDISHNIRNIRVGLVFILKDMGHKIRDIRVGLIFISTDISHKIRVIRVGLVFISRDISHNIRNIRAGLIFISNDMGHKIRVIWVGLVFTCRNIRYKIREIRVGLVFISRNIRYKIRDIWVGLVFISRNIRYKIRDIRVGLIFISMDQLQNQGHPGRFGLYIQGSATRSGTSGDISHKIRDIRVGLVFTSRDIRHKIRDIRLGLVYISEEQRRCGIVTYVTALALIDTDLETRERLEKSLHYDMDKPHSSYYGIDNNFTFL